MPELRPLKIEPYHSNTYTLYGSVEMNDDRSAWGSLASEMQAAFGTISSDFDLGVNSNFSTPSLSNTLPNKKSSGSDILTTPGISHEADIANRMRQIEWSRGYSWDVYIDPAPPYPFNNTNYGLPVTEVKDAVGMSRPWDIDAGCSTYRMPKGKALFDISLSFLDDENGTMEQYFERWFEQVCPWEGLNGGDGCVSYLEDAVRHIRITKLNSKRQAIFTRRYLVYPDGEIFGFNNSESGTRTYNVILTVAGYLGKNS